MQKLPNGEYWSSLASTVTHPKALLKSAVACAQRVAILPSVPPATPVRATLGSLEYINKGPYKFKPLQFQPRQVSQGTFLDYGSYTSFAPSWDSEGAELGRDSVGACLESRRLRRKEKGKESERTTIDVDPALLESETHMNGLVDRESEPELDETLDISRLLEKLEVENESNRLLEKSASAIERLRYLQNLRLLRGDKVMRDQLEHSTGEHFYSHGFLLFNGHRTRQPQN